MMFGFDGSQVSLLELSVLAGCRTREASAGLHPFVAPSPTASAHAAAVISESIESRHTCNSHGMIPGAKTGS